MKNIKFNYSKLRGRIVEVFGVESVFAEKLGISHTTLSKKFMNKTFFSQEQIAMAMDLLELSRKEINEYFFSTTVSFF